MFSTHLRKRPEWAPAVPALLASQYPRFQEKTFETHDMALPLRTPSSLFFFLLLSPSDFTPSGNGMSRIERLFNFNGGNNVGIVFLLHEDLNTGMFTYMRLQVNLLGSSLEMPILPIHNIESLQTTLFGYHRQLLRAQIILPQTNAANSILPYCSSKPPLLEHTRNILSDIFCGFREFGGATLTEEGRNRIERYLDDENTKEEVIGFWAEEYIAD